ncbi:ulp1 protease family, C-terminal catalytic domain-containing protein [Tanacetum coccineum]
MSMYVNEVNVVNENQPPSSEKVVGQLIRKRFVGKALVEPYTVQPPTTAPSAFLKVDRKRLKRKARLLQIQNTRISFDDDVGDDDPDFKVLSLEEWVFFSINEPNKHYCLGVLHIRTGVITLYDSLFSEAVETRKWWIKMRKAFKKYIPPYLQEWGILDAKGIPLESYNINFVIGKDVPIQGDAYGDCGVWVCIFLYRLIHKMAVSAKDPQIVGLAYREHMFDYFWKYKIAN